MSHGFKLSHHVFVVFAFAECDAEQEGVKVGEVGKEGGKFAVCHLYVVYGLWAAAVGVVVYLLGAKTAALFLECFPCDQCFCGSFVQADQIAVEFHRFVMAGKEPPFVECFVLVVRIAVEKERIAVKFRRGRVQRVLDVLLEYFDYC